MQPNLQIGQFVLERPLGEGGMAEVWLGHNTHLGTPVAVKFLNQQFSANREMQERFLNEGRRQSALNHPNIVKVFGWEQLENRSFLVLQYIQGEPLDVRLGRTGKLGFGEAMHIAGGVLSALHYAHSQQIVHRDVKPSNILLDQGGNAFLGDFGIVLAMNEQRKTRTGTSMGTPHYMSPEQISMPMRVDHRTDIYSFGCVFYEMLSDRTPFHHTEAAGHDSDFNVKMAHVNSPPMPLRQVNPAVPPAVEAVVMRCLAKDPAQRFTHCAEVYEALRLAFAGGQSAAVPRVVPGPVTQPALAPVPQPAPWRIAGLIAGCFLLLLGGGAGYWYLQQKPKLAVEPIRKEEQKEKKKEIVPPVIEGDPLERERLQEQSDQQEGKRLPPVVVVEEQKEQKREPEVPVKKEEVKREEKKEERAARGTLSWSGDLAKGERVTIHGLTCSSGTVTGAPLPHDQWVEIRLDNKTIGVAEAPSVASGNRLTLRASKKLNDIHVTIQWRVVQ